MSINLEGKVTYCGSEGGVFLWEHPCVDCEASILGVRAASLILPQGVLATVPWIRGVCGVQSLRWDIVQGLLFTLWSSQPCLSHLLEFTEPDSYENV